MFLKIRLQSLIPALITKEPTTVCLTEEPPMTTECSNKQDLPMHPNISQRIKNALFSLKTPRIDLTKIFESPQVYLGLSLTMMGLAGGCYPMCLPIAIILSAGAGWFLWSATITRMNQIMKETYCVKRLIQHMNAGTLEVNAAIATAALFPFTFFTNYHKPRKNLSGRPILMVNGYASFGSTWHFHAQKLTRAGLGPIYTMNVGTGKSIKTYAEEIQEIVKKIQKETGRNDLILIGHSKGGLVSTYYATHLTSKTNTNITDVITIGSPLKGTPLAYLAPGKDAKEMRSDAQFHQELRERIKENPEIRFYHIASKSDAVVPYSSALIGETPSREQTLEDVGHLGLLFSSTVADQICIWLKND